MGLLAGPARAQTAEELAGTWKRVPNADNPTARYYRFEAKGSGLEGKLLNPPDGLACTVTLAVEGGKVTGKGAWTEGEHHAEALWDFHVESGALVGRSEWLDWEDGVLHEKGWEDHRLERVARVGLVTAGKAEAPMGEPVPLPSLCGGWVGLGRAWEAKVDGTSLALIAVGEPALRIDLQDERGTLRGKAKQADGLETKVELAHDDGKLVGRAEWIEGKELGADLMASGWAPLELTRATRIDAHDGVAADAPAGAAGELDGVYRRDDGLFLRVHDEGGQKVGVLCTKEGAAKARVRFEQKDQVWVGTANWDGVEARWELAPSGEGAEAGLAGRCEWVDAHEGRAIARGFAPRTFTRLRRVH